MQDISALVSQHAARSPDRLALQGFECRLTYAELDRAANRLSNHLTALGLVCGDAVAIVCTRSCNQIIASLATMRAGGVYIPVDPVWPHERVRHILKDSGAAILIASKEIANAVPPGLMVIDPQAKAITAAASVRKDTVLRQDSLAYIIYTSGSTGVPKGVEITHANLSHLIHWHKETFSITPQDRASHLAGLGFDASVWEVWPYLAVGACVVLADDVVRTSSALLRDWLIAEEITMAFVPTPLAEPMMIEKWPQKSSLRCLLTGGDTLHRRPAPGQPFVVFNNYGPTECTVVTTSGIVSPDHKTMPTIGKAIAGTQVYVLNEQQQIAELGESGELFIGGDGVGRGYRNLPELTARCFVPDQFSGAAGGRLYRTGDQAAMLADGQIVFQGRLDGQVKIRGQRLELDEIICVLNQHIGVASSIAVTRSTGEAKHLVAYILPIPGSEATLSARDLQEFAARSLPGFMIPAIFVRLESIPTTTNGKVDYSLLPDPSPENALSERPPRATATPVEEAILSIVQTLLQNKDVGVDDDFFLVGGHSLMGTRLVIRIREAFGVNLMLRDLFEAGTVAQLANHIESMILADINAMSEEEAASEAAG